MKRIVPVAIGIIYDKSTHKLLLAERKGTDREDRKYGRSWNFPGGGIEFGEDPITALRREIQEELHVQINIIQMLPRIFSPVRGNWHGLLICYLCSLQDPSQPIVLNEESTQYGWFNLEEIKNLRLLPLGYEIAETAYKLL